MKKIIIISIVAFLSSCNQKEEIKVSQEQKNIKVKTENKDSSFVGSWIFYNVLDSTYLSRSLIITQNKDNTINIYDKHTDSFLGKNKSSINDTVFLNYKNLPINDYTMFICLDNEFLKYSCKKSSCNTLFYKK